MPTVEKLRYRRFYLWIISVVSVHSLAMGAALCFAPTLFLHKTGWPYAERFFFPSQSGVFLIILAGGYFAALRYYRMVYFILLSKVVAVVFLGTHYFFLDAPRQLLTTFIIDLVFAILLTQVILLTGSARKTSRR